VLDKNQLLSQIGHGLKFSKYELAQYDEDVLVAFLHDGQGIFIDIPEDMITNQIRLAAAEYDKTGTIMQHLRPGTPDYRSLAIAAVTADWRNLKDVDSTCVDCDFMMAVLDQSPEVLFAFFIDYSELTHTAFERDSLEQFLQINPGALDLTVSHYVSGSFSTPLLTDAFIQKSALSMPGVGSTVFKSAKQHLLIEGIRAGGWPQILEGDKPVDLEHGVKLVMKATSSMKLAWHKAYIKSHDLKDVVKIMSTPAREQMLLSLYTKAELLPFMHQNQRVKGKWLEDEMGL
jgi:hypothetical protein